MYEMARKHKTQSDTKQTTGSLTVLSWLISPFPHLFITLGGTDAYMQEPEYAAFRRGRLVPSHGRRFTLVCLLMSKRDYGDAGEWRPGDRQSTAAKLIDSESIFPPNMAY